MHSPRMPVALTLAAEVFADLRDTNRAAARRLVIFGHGRKGDELHAVRMAMQIAPLFAIVAQAV